MRSALALAVLAGALVSGWAIPAGKPIGLGLAAFLVALVALVVLVVSR